MIDIQESEPGIQVMTAQLEPFAIVDAVVNADVIKLKPDISGGYHMIPVSWMIATHGGIVKVNRIWVQVKQAWATH